MNITRTIELNEDEVRIVTEFLQITDKISDIARCSMDDVFLYFADNAKVLDNNKYAIGKLHQIDDIS